MAHKIRTKPPYRASGLVLRCDPVIGSNAHLTAGAGTILIVIGGPLGVGLSNFALIWGAMIAAIYLANGY